MPTYTVMGEPPTLPDINRGGLSLEEMIPKYRKLEAYDTIKVIFYSENY